MQQCDTDRPKLFGNESRNASFKYSSVRPTSLVMPSHSLQSTSPYSCV